MGSLTFASGAVEAADDVASGRPDIATSVIDAGTTVKLSGPTDNQVNFAAVTGTLTLQNSSSFDGQISGFGGEHRIDLADVFFGTSTTLAYSNQDNDSGTTLTVSDGTNTASLVLLGQYLVSHFAVSSDGNGGTFITDSLPPAATVANGAGVDGGSANSAAAPAGVLASNNSSAATGMLSATVEHVAPEITNGLVMAYSMSTGAFAVGTTTLDPAVLSGGNAFASVSTTPDPALSSEGDSFAFVANAGSSNGNPVANIIPQNSGLTNTGATGGATSDPAGPPLNTWQQNVALMSNYLASTFPAGTFGASGSQDTGASLSTPVQGALAAQVLADHQNSS
jgi:hypothetical protein